MNYKKLCLSSNYTAKEAMKEINRLGIPNLALFITDEHEKLVGAISDGDIRRGLLDGKELNLPVTQFMNAQAKYFLKGENNYEKFEKFKSLGIRFIPILNADLSIIDLLDLDQYKAQLPIDAVIMAGGRGERLSPMTDSVPKPMLNVGDKPIIKWNIDRLKEYGITNIYITVRYLKDVIKSGLKEDITENNFISEDAPLGTIGSIKLIPKFYKDHILLMNSDVLTNIDFEEFYKNFIETKADLQIATIPYNVTIPYGVVEINEQSQSVTHLKEKPRYTYYTNAGIYIFKKDLIDLIPSNVRFDATDFVELLIKNNYNVVSFPMYCYWLDIGQPEDFYKAQEDVKHIEF
jgi:dTDP-glucose pyrophosphorylase